MTISLRKYEPNDLYKVRDFIIRTQSLLGHPNNWGIDRWEFVPFFQETRNGTLEQWQSRIGIWEDENGDIAAVACDDGDVYFLLDSLEPGEQLVQELFEYAEEKLLIFEPGQLCTRNALAITAGMKGIERIAESRGYTRGPGEDTIMSLTLDRDFQVFLPQGYVIKTGEEVDSRTKALGHIMAFDYAGTSDADKTLLHYGNIAKAPDYRAGLELSVLNTAGEVVSFCSLWWDEANKVATLEPVGTHKAYRCKGLGKAVIYEGLNRLKTLGAVKVYVGSGQTFYRKIGFEPEVSMYRWIQSKR